ncbi:hypothetical protein V500_10964 [Pseudogymnoascus sp. VKM F-4518 (FW-2643)]|nr:hypothetical protein V500_10964 [Pseudogymnoascus sp. VKM F-4518 (FW-2643)]
MMEAEAVLHQQMPSGYRNLQPQVSHGLQHGQPHMSHQSLGPQNGLDLSGLDDNDAVFQQGLQSLQSAAHSQVFHSPNTFDGNHGHRHMHHQPSGSPHTPQQHQPHHPFPILTPTHLQHNAIAKLQEDEDIFGSPGGSDQKSNGHLSTRVVADPPNIAEWRKKLFDVDEMITLSQDQFETYFAHVDNVYSHRSTQRYKRKPFVSHYWDCRLKGRPPGTPKSEDPNKKKRKRVARERDLCDVKIKITEYFPGAMLRPDFVPDGGQSIDGNNNGEFYSPNTASGLGVQDSRRSYGGPNTGEQSHPGSTGERFYTIQRVNGNGGNGKGDGIAGPHKHTLEESDRVKKNSVQRFLMKRDKEERKSMKTTTRKASGAALVTTRKRSKDQDLKLFGTCSSPYVQRVWIALEAKDIPYQYIEVDPLRKPASHLEINPAGPVPTLRHGNWGCSDSTVLLEYLDDLGLGIPLLPSDPCMRATARLWADHVNRAVVPAFYTVLQFSPADKTLEAVATLQDEINKMVEAADVEGPFFLGATLGHVDVVFAPWMLRCSRMLKKFRGWPDPEPGSRWERWVGAVEGCEAVRATCCGEDVYEDAFARWTQGKGTEVEDGGYGVP